MFTKVEDCLQLYRVQLQHIEHYGKSTEISTVFFI